MLIALIIMFIITLWFYERERTKLHDQLHQLLDVLGQLLELESVNDQFGPPHLDFDQAGRDFDTAEALDELRRDIAQHGPSLMLIPNDASEGDAWPGSDGLYDHEKDGL
jgi:hypothetical protein